MLLLIIIDTTQRREYHPGSPVIKRNSRLVDQVALGLRGESDKLRREEFPITKGVE
jgi:hypothetical protein